MSSYRFIFLLIIFLSQSITAQEIFKQGYFITNSGERIQCLISDPGWSSNPTGFEYKIGKTIEIHTAMLDDISEFGIKGGVKFIKRKVRIDVISNQDQNLTTNPNPEFTEQVVFLKVLVEGAASLFSYVENDSEVFLYQPKGGSIKQLVYKKYWIDSNQSQSVFNTAYINELKTNVSVNVNNFEEPGYNEKSLVRYFKEYNTDFEKVFKNYYKNRSARLVLAPIFGIQKTNFNFDHNRDQYDRKVDGNAYRFGVLLEYRIPYKNHRWAVLVEPSINFFEVTEQKEDWRNPVLVDAKRIELGFGVRHYVPVSENGSFFANFMIPFGLDQDTKIEPGYGDNKWISNYLTTSVSGGVGFRMSQFTIEARYDHNRNLLPDRPNFDALLSGVSFNAGFTLLNF